MARRTTVTEPYEIANALTKLAQMCADSDQALYDLAVTAHDQGTLTWAEIGAAIGVSRQAAWERFTQARLRKPVPRVHPGQGRLT